MKFPFYSQIFHFSKMCKKTTWYLLFQDMGLGGIIRERTKIWNDYICDTFKFWCVPSLNIFLIYLVFFLPKTQSKEFRSNRETIFFYTDRDFLFISFWLHPFFSKGTGVEDHYKPIFFVFSSGFFDEIFFHVFFGFHMLQQYKLNQIIFIAQVSFVPSRFFQGFFLCKNLE